MTEKISVLVLGPRQQDYAAVKEAKNSMPEYDFHFIDPPHPMVYGTMMPSEEFSKTLDYLGFVNEVVEYINHKKIRGVVFSYDNMALIGAAVCQEVSLPGPSVESEFLCLHKYYSRKMEPSRLWCECVSLTENLVYQVDRLQFPCFMKPATLTGSLGIAKVESSADLERHLAIYAKSIPSLVEAMQPLFKKYLDLSLYPLAVAPVAVVEEFVEDHGKYHCLEGWSDSKGKFHHWCTYDSDCLTYGKEKLVGFFIPSSETEDSLSMIKSCTSKAVENHKLKSVFFNVDLWKRGKRVDIIEINGRCTPSTMGIYRVLYSSSIYKAMVHLACGEDEKCEQESPDKKPTPPLQSGRFRWYTQREGKAQEIVNFSKATTIGETEEVFDVMGKKTRGIMLYVTNESDEYVLPGTQLGAFVLFGTNRLEIWERAKHILIQLAL